MEDGGEAHGVEAAARGVRAMRRRGRGQARPLYAREAHTCAFEHAAFLDDAGDAPATRRADPFVRPKRAAGYRLARGNEAALKAGHVGVAGFE